MTYVPIPVVTNATNASSTPAPKWFSISAFSVLITVVISIVIILIRLLIDSIREKDLDWILLNIASLAIMLGLGAFTTVCLIVSLCN